MLIIGSRIRGLPCSLLLLPSTFYGTTKRGKGVIIVSNQQLLTAKKEGFETIIMEAIIAIEIRYVRVDEPPN